MILFQFLCLFRSWFTPHSRINRIENNCYFLSSNTYNTTVQVVSPRSNIRFTFLRSLERIVFMIMMSLLAHSSLQHWSIIRSCRSSIPISSLLPLYQRNYVSLLLPEVASSSSISNIAIVQGASRGIGLEFCRQLLAKRYSCKQNTNEEVDFENPVYRVYATCR